jgi:2-C-methyl-D-erythritol 4-phosphate cytidylyltransferase
MIERLAVILPAAGSSTRFGGGRNKLLESLNGKTVLARSVAAFLTRRDVVLLVIATASESMMREALGELANDPRVQFVPGGATRADSVRGALAHLPAEIEWVAVHDAARPLVSGEVIDRVLQAAHQHGAAAPALPVSLTIKQATGPLPAKVEQTVPRASLWAMQTPQVARRADLLAAMAACLLPADQITDDLQVLELAGCAVWLVQGDERNLKITTQLDMDLATLLTAEA